MDEHPGALKVEGLGSVVAGELLGHGAEGAVWSVKERADLAVKIFHGGRMPAPTRKKVDALMRRPPDTVRNRHYRLAWPVGTVSRTTNGGRRMTCGYAMPRLNHGRHPEIGVYFNQARRDRRAAARGRPLTAMHLLTIAQNLALMVAKVHEAGYVIGDLNSRNVRASDSGQVALIDIDSMQVPDPGGNGVMRCIVGAPEYCPPERQGTGFANADRTEDDDRFALGVMIYQLLFQGRHPFAGVSGTEGEADNSIAGRIRKGALIHDAADGGKPTAHDRLVWTATPFKRQFRSALGPAPPRYGAHRWVEDIEKAAEGMKQCAANPAHQYFGNRACTWCRYAKRAGRDPFAVRERTAPARTTGSARRQNRR